MSDETITKIILAALWFIIGVFLSLLILNTSKYIEAQAEERKNAELKANADIKPEIRAYKIELKNIHAIRIICAEYFRANKDYIEFIKSHEIVAWFSKDEIRTIELLETKNQKSEQVKKWLESEVTENDR